MKAPSKNGGFYYRNELWFSEAYRCLPPAAKDLLHCFTTELRWEYKSKKKYFFNNGDISFSESQFKELLGYSSETYLKARNQLIKVGLIRQTYRGGNGRGDRARYKLLMVDGIPTKEQRWKDYPSKSWEDEIPRSKNSLVGKHTRFRPGKSGRKDISHPNRVGALRHKPPNKVGT